MSDKLNKSGVLNKINEYNNNHNIKYVHKFNLRKNILNKNIINKDSQKEEKNEGDNIKYEKINSNLMDIISEDKIDDLSKNCPIPSFEDKDYSYIGSLGEGSFGKIYLVEDKKTKEQYALKKVICKDYQELLKFKKEFELLYSLKNHINIMKIYKLQIKSLDITTSCLYVLMERAQNDWNLEIHRRIIARKFYRENEIIEILKQITSGLYYLQKNKIAHRDIKPQNILIYPNNIYKIADLGEAKSILNNRIQMATLRGSELFMSPLLYNGLKYSKKNIRHNPFKSDMFSLGYCFLYAICLNLKVLEYIREMTDMNNIENMVNKFIDKGKYSDKLIHLIYKMIELDEDKRLDFEQLEKEIKANFK